MYSKKIMNAVFSSMFKNQKFFVFFLAAIPEISSLSKKPFNSIHSIVLHMVRLWPEIHSPFLYVISIQFYIFCGGFLSETYDAFEVMGWKLIPWWMKDLYTSLLFCSNAGLIASTEGQKSRGVHTQRSQQSHQGIVSRSISIAIIGPFILMTSTGIPSVL